MLARLNVLFLLLLNMNTFFNMPDAEMKLMLEEAAESPPHGHEIE
jgi:hypothetical protein